MSQSLRGADRLCAAVLGAWLLAARVAAQTYDYQVVHVFHDDGYPQNSLIQARDGSFYGTTRLGGANGAGSLFRMDAAGHVETLYSFFGNGDGAYPVAPLLEAPDGAFYGVTSKGGVHDFGTIFRMDAAGAVTTLHAFTGEEGAGAHGLVEAVDGTLYGTTSASVFRMDRAGAVSLLHRFPTTISSLVRGSDGSIYGTTTTRTTCVRKCFFRCCLTARLPGSFFKIDTAGILTTIANLGGTGADLGRDLIAGADGAFYGLTATGGAHGVGTVFRMTASGSITTIHTFEGADGSTPRALAQSRSGWIYG